MALSANGNVALVADPGPPGPGSVIPYTLSNGIFSEGNPLPTPAHASAFGTALALSQTGNVALVGDPTGGSLGKGAATVYTDNAGSWVQNASLVPVGTPAQFGASVALSASGATALVGDPTAQTYGTATVYDFSGSWSAGTPLTVTPNAGNFGTAVALSANGTIAAVGDPDGGLSGGDGHGLLTRCHDRSDQLERVSEPILCEQRFADQVFGHHLGWEWNADRHRHLQHGAPHAVHSERLGWCRELLREQHPA